MATLIGVGICCVVPLGAFALGIVYARYGIPLSIRWRGFKDAEDE
jgi:hypothetical protein